MKKALLDELVKNCAKTMNDASFKAALTLFAKNRSYSLLNRILIHSQKPFASLVAGYRQWEEMGRHVKEGEKGISILAPIKKKKLVKEKYIDEDGIEQTVEVEKEVVIGFKLAKVFDISQTYGKDIEPKQVEDDAMTKIPAEALIETIVEKSPVPVEFKNMDKTGIFYPDSNIANSKIEINSSLSTLMQLRSLIHNLAHYFHYASIVSSKEEMPKHEEAEVIAESVAYLFLSNYGFDVSKFSIPFIVLWSTGDGSRITKNIAMIEKIFKQILSLVVGEAETETEEEKIAV